MARFQPIYMHSTEIALLRVLRMNGCITITWITSFNITGVLFLDLTKAFDTVNHRI